MLVRKNSTTKITIGSSISVNSVDEYDDFKDINMDKIADMFINMLLEMKHVSTVTSLDNYYYQLLLFLDPDGFLYNSDKNEHFMVNASKLKQIMPETIFYCCDILINGTIINKYKKICDPKWYAFLKKKFIPSQHVEQQNDKEKINGYSSNYKCSELFYLIVQKLEKLEYSEEYYVNMADEFDELKPKITTLTEDENKASKNIDKLRIQLNKTDNVKNDAYKNTLIQLDEAGKQLLRLKMYKIRYDYLSKLLVSENIRKVRNIKIFIDAVKNTEDYKILNKRIIDNRNSVPSAPAMPIISTVTGQEIKNFV